MITMKTTIQLEKETVNSLKTLKGHPKESYNEIILNLIRFFNNVKGQNQYDEFLHQIQQSKMKELWDNIEDEAWENA